VPTTENLQEKIEYELHISESDIVACV